MLLQKSNLHYQAVLAAILLFVNLPANAQDILWEKSYGGKHSDYLFDVQATPDYGFLLAGSSLSDKTGNKTDANGGDLDYWVWKMDEKGELDWQKGFGGTGADLLQGIRLTSDAGFILAGTSDSQKGGHKKDSCRGREDFWVIKLNAKGGEQWQRTIGGSGQEQLQSVFQTADGGYVLGGSSSSPRSGLLKNGRTDSFGKSEDGFGNLDYWVVKLDSEGEVEWQKAFGGTYADQLRSVEQTSDGGYLLGGYSNSPASGNKTEACYGTGDYWVLKLDREGEIEWQKAYGGDGDDQLYAVHQTQDGNYVLGGSSGSGNTGNKNASNGKGTDFWVLKLDTAGEILWQRTYDIGKMDLLASLVENRDGSLLLGGHAQSETAGTRKADREQINDYIAIKTDKDGEELWTQSVGSRGEDILKKAIEVRGGGYLLAGTSKGAVSRDRHSGKGRDDFWVVMLKDRNRKKEKKSPIEAFPNPTLHYTNVVVGYEFQKGTATVFDLSGRQLQQFEITDRTVPVDLGGVPEGIYIVEIRTNVQNDAVKVVKAVSKQQ